MYDENNITGGLPEEIDYTPNAPKKEGPTGVTAPVLDDFEYVAPSAKKDGPTGVSAPVLDDMDSFASSDSYKKGAPSGISAPILDDNMGYGQPEEKKGAPTGVSAPVLDDSMGYRQPEEKKGAPTGVSAPVLDDNVPYTHEKLVLSDEDIISGLTPELKARFDALPAEKQQQIIDMRRTQLGAVAPPAEISAPVLDEDNYTPPPKKEEPKQPEAPITAPILDDEPEPPKYQPKYVDEDLERVKAEASKKAVSAQLTSDQKDSKASLQMMLALKEEARQREAQKGFKITVVLAVLGVVAAVVFFLLYSGQLGLGYKDGLSGISKVIESSALYIAGGVGILSLLLLTGISAIKSFTSFIFLLFGVIQLFPGIFMINQHKGNTGLAVALYAVSLALTIVVFFMLSGSEAVGLFFKKNKS
ncbi:ABC transporter permease [Ruminococcus flavefaciens]|uniref:ABC transporter permease n=1 Tax=Ruminococcus flavefaciens TaxID=1265 RepID=UPI0026EC917E|nr:ABC transporter permease [Ruminococcus flavefaciens]MDD7515977.1 ABC transporter permease [Ruminococcus flavefaciens]MDY5691676.1 ABC transporter permease [Ruminococcus flavefaciens]